MQAYLNSYALGRGGIVFPGSQPVAKFVEAGKNRLVELPLRAAWGVSLNFSDRCVVRGCGGGACKHFSAYTLCRTPKKYVYNVLKTLKKI